MLWWRRGIQQEGVGCPAGTRMAVPTPTACSEITRWSWHRACPPSSPSFPWVGSGQISEDLGLPHFHLWCKGKNQPLYPGAALQKSKNYLRVPGALIKALANVPILLQTLIGCLEPVQLQNKYNPKQMGKKTLNKKNLKTQKSWGTTSAIFRARIHLLIPAQVCYQYL